jgi:hypothetical protein
VRPPRDTHASGFDDSAAVVSRDSLSVEAQKARGIVIEDGAPLLCREPIDTLEPAHDRSRRPGVGAEHDAVAEPGVDQAG